jgi:hypothetical protein
MKSLRATSAAPVAAPSRQQHESWLLWRLVQVAARRETCPSIEALAAERGLSRASTARLFELLEERGAIKSTIAGGLRVVTIIATGTQTAAASGLPEIPCPWCNGLFRPRDRRQHLLHAKRAGRRHGTRKTNPCGSDDEPESEFPPHSPQGRNESGVRPAPTIFEMPKAWRAYRYEDHPEAKRRYDERKARGYQPKIYPHHSNVSRGDSPLGDFFLMTWSVADGPLARPVVVNERGDPICWPNDAKDAPMIAAAPKLVAALQELMDSRPVEGALTAREAAARHTARLAICEALGRS